jgi:AraC-like DNA-binding protein
MKSKFMIFRGSSPDEIETALNPLFGAVVSKAPKSNFAASDMFGVTHEDGGLFWQRGFDGIEIQAETKAHLQIFSLSGGMSIDLDKGRIVGGCDHQIIVPNNTLIRKSFMENSQQVYLMFTDSAIQKKARLLLGDDRNATIVPTAEAREIDGFRDVSKGIISSVVEYINRENANIDDLFVKETFDYLSTLFVIANSRGILQGIARQESDQGLDVQLVIDYIEANLRNPLALENLVAISGTSASTLLRAFRRKTGKTPMSYIKQLRLERARQIFLSNADDISVIKVIYDCGFGNTGHFSREYRELFGELPSDTLRRRRRA